MVKRYVNVTASDVVAVMKKPAPGSPAVAVSQGEPQQNSGAMSQEALQAAMQMLQAAAAQLNVQAASATATPAHVPARPAANDDGDVGAIA